MKRRIFMLTMGISVLLCACGNETSVVTMENDTQEVQESTLEKTTVSDMEESSAVESVNESADDASEIIWEDTLFDEQFMELSNKVGVMTFEECVKYIAECSLPNEIVEPSEDEMGKITVNGDKGFHLVMYFYPDDNGIETITLLSYSNGDFEGSVNDNSHIMEPEYGIYDFTAETRNMKVDSIDDVVKFIKCEMPLKLDEYSESVQDNGELEVSLEPTYEEKDGKIIFTIKTNLPDNTKLLLTLSDEADYTGQTSIFVKDGIAVSEGFAKKGEALSGHYTLKINTTMAKLQDDSVIAIIGSKGEFLKGQYVEESSTGGGNIVVGIFDFDF